MMIRRAHWRYRTVRTWACGGSLQVKQQMGFKNNKVAAAGLWSIMHGRRTRN
jgi:hypothetical protein